MICGSGGSSIWNSWTFKHSKLENHQGYLKANDTINLNITMYSGQQRGSYIGGSEIILRSHDIQFTVGDNTFQEAVCHNERLGGNDEVSNFFDFIFIT